MTRSAYNDDLPKSAANYQPLTPLVFLDRSARIFPDRLAVVHGRQRVSYGEFYARTPAACIGACEARDRRRRHRLRHAGEHAADA